MHINVVLHEGTLLSNLSSPFTGEMIYKINKHLAMLLCCIAKTFSLVLAHNGIQTK